MAKFIYLGKKKNFKLDSVYQHQDVLEPQGTFELTGKDLVLMKRCIDIAKASDGSPAVFKLLDEHIIEEETKKAKKKVSRKTKKSGGE